jgi:ribosomal protein S18 acetylase RimI-like enzyme
VFQGVGLGRRLFSTVRQGLRGEGLSKLVVWALRENEAACAFYHRLGGTIAAASPERYGDARLTRVAFLWGVRVRPSPG